MAKKQKYFLWGKYLKPYTALCVVGPFFKLLEAATDILTPFFMAKIIDVGIANNDLPYIYKFSAIILGMNILAICFALICQKCSTLTSQGVAKNIRGDMYAHINTYSFAELDGFSTASLVNRTVNDVNQVEAAVSTSIRLLTRAPFLLIGCAVMAMLIDLQLSIIFLVVIPLITISMLFITKRTFPHYERSKKELDVLSNITRENLSGVRVVRAFNKEKYETKRFEESNARLTAIDTKVVRLTAIMQPVISIIINFAVIAIIYWGGVRVNVGSISQGNVIAFINYFTQISMALVTIARMVIVYTRTFAATNRIDEVLSVTNSIKETSTPAVYDFSTRKGASLEFVGVSFAYPKTADVVNNLTFKIEPGEVLGIIGGTGSGKSSIINLIPRFYDVSKGSILIDGVDIKNYSIEELRKIVSVVPQNVVLFEGTIASNLKWRNNNATIDELIKVLKISQSYEFVSEKPKFLDSIVNRGGKNFSGGQRQRLTIARALVGNPQILILDDAASALDLATDSKLRKALNTSLSGVTKIFVSQRASSLMHADKIIVMENGVPLDIGKHEELYARCKVYQEICDSQNLKAEGK